MKLTSRTKNMVRHSKRPEDQTDHEHHQEGQHTGKDTSNSSLTLVSSMMGASLLSIAFIIHKLGWVISTIAILITLVWSYIVYYYYIQATHYTNSVSYPELAQKLFNKKISILLNICIIVSNYGFCTGYIIISSKQIIMFIQTVMKRPKLVEELPYLPYIVKGVIAMGITWPLCCIRKLSILGKIASVSGLFLLITTITILVYFGINAKAGKWCYGGGANGDYIYYNLPTFPPPKNGKPVSVLYRVLYFFMYIPSLQGNFSVQTVIPSLLHDLQGPRVIKKKVTYVSVCIAISISLIFYAIVGYFGAAMFGDQTADNILSAFGPCQELWPAICGLLYALVVIIVYPLIVFPNKVAILQICNIDYDTNKGYKYSLIISFLFPALTMTLAMVLEQIVTIFGFFSSISGILYYFIVPVSCALKMKKLRFLNPDADKMEEGDITVDPVLVGVMSMFGSVVNKQSISKARAMSMKMFPEKPVAESEIVSATENQSPAELGSQIQRRASISKKPRTLSMLRPRTFSIQKVADDHYKIRTNSTVRRKSSVNSALSASISSKNNPKLKSQEQNLIDDEMVDKVYEKSRLEETTPSGSSQKKDSEPQKNIVQHGYDEQMKALEAVHEVDEELQGKPSRFKAQHTVDHDVEDEETTVEEIQLDNSNDGSTISKTRMAVCITVMAITTAICIEGIYMNGIDVIESFS